MAKDKTKYNNYQREYQLKRYHERMATAKIRLGNRCVECGTTEDLEIDHIDPAKKTIKLSNLWSIAEHLFNAELEKCQLLCSNCHRNKSKIDIGVEHGGGVSGKFITTDGKRKGCPCGPCTLKRKEYMRRYRK
jgi:5-methylcytosine-specific restriction endonuclease McrA